MYTAMSRVSSFHKLFLIVKFTVQEYERLHQDSIFENTEKICVTDDTTTILLLNIRSLSKLWYGIKSDVRLMNNDILFRGNTAAASTFTEWYWAIFSKF